jgi:hypothetical protein
MEKKTKKRFTKLALAGLLVARGVPVVASPFNVGDRVDSALKNARDQVQVSLDDIDALAYLDTDDATIGMY